MTEAPAQKSLPETYYDFMSSYIDERGVPIAHGLVVDASGELTMLALDLTPTQIYALMLAQWRKQPREMIFALDRFAQPDQGTTLGDLLAGHHFVAGAPPRPFIIEYQHEPRIVKPIEWANTFWNDALLRELGAALQSVGGINFLKAPAL